MLGANAGAAVAPLIVVPIAAAYSWRAPFYVNGFIGVIWVIICYSWFRNNPSEMKKIRTEEKELIENNRRFISHTQPFSWKAALRSRSLWAIILSFYCLQWASYFFLAWMPVYLQEGRHFSENNMKTTTASLFVVSIFSALLAGIVNDWLVKRKGVRFARRFIALLCFTLMSGLLLLTAVTTNNTVVVVSLITANFFNGPCAITAATVCVDIGGNHAGTLAGIMGSVGQIGAFFMVIVFGKIVDLTHSFSAPIFILSAVLLLGGLLWLLVDADKQLALETIEKH